MQQLRRFMKERIPFSSLLTKKEKEEREREETDVGPAICKFSKDAVSQSARQPFLTAWATLSKCLLHIKEDVAAAVTMMNAFKTSHLRPVASPFHGAEGSGSGAPQEPELQPKCARAAPSVGRRGNWGLSQPHSCSHSVLFLVRAQIRQNGLKS